MSKLPKKIRNLTDLQVRAKALHDPKLRTEAAQRIIEARDPSGQTKKFIEPDALNVIAEGLNGPNNGERMKLARWVLKADPEGLSLLESEPELGIERAREVVRDRKKIFEDEEKSRPPN